MLTKKTSVTFSLASAVIGVMLVIATPDPTPQKPDAGGFEWGLTTPTASAPARVNPASPA
jgi:hypothetical protein